MHLNLIALIAPLLVTGALADCQQGGHRCYWEGTSPSCGGSRSDSLGTVERGDKLTEWTRYDSASTLLANGDISDSCYNDYGAGCLSGYKRLWCADPSYF